MGPSTGVTLPQLPNYSPDLFVNREEAIQLVVNKVHRISSGTPERKRVIVFEGYRGSGKSWLLQHLAREILGVPGAAAAYINLRDHKAKAPNVAVIDVIEQIGGCLGASTAFLTVEVAANRLIEAVNAHTDTVLVLLVDFVYEAPQEILESLEKHVLGPLVVIPHVVIVMAGRGQAYPWLTLRLRFDAEYHELEPFSEVEHTREQLKKQRPNAALHADDIHKATRGYPLANVVIPYPLAKATLAEMKTMIDLLLEPIRKPDGTWPPERQHLEALCVLRTFDEERIPILLDAYNGKQVISNFALYYNSSGPARGGWTLAKASEIFRGLIATQLVRWNSDAGGWWIVDQAIRELLEEYLRVAEPDRWRCCHETAINLYQDWRARYPEEAALWEEEVKHHETGLSHLKQNQDDPGIASGEEHDDKRSRRVHFGEGDA